MTEALTTQDEQRPLSTIEMLSQAAKKSGAAEAVQLFGLLERAEKREAEKAFTAAFTRLKFPPIAKKTKGHTNKYAAFDDIQEVIDPILEAEGFTLTYSSGPANDKGLIPTYGLLAHVAGHSHRGEIWLPPDGVATRSGGVNMNALQAVGSSTSYGQRYVAKMMLNLRFIGDDDDGNVVSQIKKDQVENIQRLIEEAGLSPQEEAAFLTFIGYKAVSDIQKAAYTSAINFLQAKKRQKAKAAEEAQK